MLVGTMRPSAGLERPGPLWSGTSLCPRQTAGGTERDADSRAAGSDASIPPSVPARGVVLIPLRCCGGRAGLPRLTAVVVHRVAHDWDSVTGSERRRLSPHLVRRRRAGTSSRSAGRARPSGSGILYN